MRYYNEFYSYDDIKLWDETSWEAHKSKGAPLFAKVLDLAKQLETVDHYAGRNDEVTDSVNRAPYFENVVAQWKQDGMIFNSCGMMGVTMIPESVAQRRNLAPKVLLVPATVDMKDPHWAMNMLENHRRLLLQAAKEEILVQFLFRDLMIELGIETQGTLKINYEPVYLDVTVLKNAGVTLTDIDGIDPADYPDETMLAGVPVVEVTDKWQDNFAHQIAISRMYRMFQKNWNDDMQIHSACGKAQAESFHMEYDYTTPADPKIASFWEKKGLLYEDHYYGNDWYVTLAPKSITTKLDQKIPLLCIMKEPRTAIPQAMQTAFQFYYDFLELAAQGQFMVLYYAMETPDDNELLVDILKEVGNKYPVDPQRIYLTGQSHNGYYGLEFYRRHPDLIAAAATLCDSIGLELGAMMKGVYEKDMDATIASFASHDMPLINFSGELENQYPSVAPGSVREEELAQYFRYRLAAFNCADRTIEEIKNAKFSSDYVTKKNGIPADRTEVQFVLGTELYISDLKNKKGKWHLRFITQENLPHMITPQMAQLCWSFLRRFARDRETGETIELY